MDRRPTADPTPLLQVALDRAPGPDPGAVGVLAGVPAGPALAQEVPALVELDLELAQPGLLALVEPVPGGLALQAVLLLDQRADTVQHLLVVHWGLLRSATGQPRRRGPP